ncbi:MAG: nuclear transport factor 2 family protein [Chitinophagaceae bacterium]
MKKGFFALAGLCLLFSCNDGNDSSSTNSSGTNTDHMAAATRNSDQNREIYRAIQTGDVSKLDSFIAPDIIDHEGNMGKDIVGLDSLKHHLAKMHTYFDGLQMEVLSEATSLDNNYHFSMIRMKGKAKANPWGMPVGMDMDDTGMDVVKIKDGKATEHWSFSSQKDVGEMMEMMSGTPQPGMMKDSVNR